MNQENITVLLIEDNPGDRRLIQEVLSDVRNVSFKVKWADRLSTGLERLANGNIDVVLLDLSLPDSQGFDTFYQIYNKKPDVPVIVLTCLDDERVALKTVHEGAQDYLIKGKVDDSILSRVIRYAIERHTMLAELRNLSLVDDLTRLYNRRGFFALTQQQLKIVKRMRKKVLLLFADIDNMKWINDTMGHQEGDLVLTETANILRKTFRESDIIARIGGDEFVILTILVNDKNVAVLTNRLQNNLEIYNRKGKHQHELSLSTGHALYDPKNPCSIDELLARADREMYEQKRIKQKG